LPHAIAFPIAEDEMAVAAQRPAEADAVLVLFQRSARQPVGVVKKVVRVESVVSEIFVDRAMPPIRPRLGDEVDN